MPAKSDRLVVDTNLWISYLLSDELLQLDALLSDEHVTLLFSQELLAEFIAVASRPKFKKYFSATDIQNLLSVLNTVGEFVDVKTSVNICRDQKDNFLLALCYDGNASFLITGDKDLLSLKKYRRTRIVSFRDYFKIR